MLTAQTFRERRSGMLAALGRSNALTAEKIAHLTEQLRLHFPDARVNGYEKLTALMTNDPKDRHVVAAAVRANAQVIVTSNLKDFPPSSLA